MHWHETAMGLHVFPIPIPPHTSLSTRSLWVFPVHQVGELVSCIQPGLVICFTIDKIHVSIPSVIRSSDIYQMLPWNCLCSSGCTCKVWISSSLWFRLGWQRYMDSWYTMGKVQWQSHAPKLCLYEMNTSPNLGPSWRKCQLKRVLVGEQEVARKRKSEWERTWRSQAVWCMQVITSDWVLTRRLV